MSKERSIRVSFPYMSILATIFIVLKLTGTGSVANWSWWWVLCPFWLPFAIFFGILFVGFLIAAVVGLIAVWLDRK